MTTENQTQNYNLVPYKINDTNIIEVTQIKDDVWLTQKQMAQLLDTTIPNISVHLKNIFESSELIETEVVKKNLKIDNHAHFSCAKDYIPTNYYNLDVIISVGYRVNSKRGVQFRKWATQVIKDRIIQEYGSKTGYSPSKYYFDYSFNELEQRISDLEEKRKNNISAIKEVLYSLMAKFESFLDRLDNLTKELKEHNKRIFTGKQARAIMVVFMDWASRDFLGYEIMFSENATTIAKGINRSSASLSLYLRSNYDGKVDVIESELKKYLSFFDKKEQTINKSLNFVDTSIVNKLFSAASMCQLKGKMGVCYGAPGIGKTTAVIEYQKNNTGVIVVDPIEQTSVRAVLEEISDQLKLHYEHNTPAGEFINNISKKLAKNKYLIIIDEAENLKVDSFKIIRKIYDKSKEYCGILFVGTYDLFEQLKRVKCGFPYITSRIGYVAQLDSLNISDISNLVVQYYPNSSVNIINKIAKVCNNNARAVQNLLDICFDVTSVKNIELNVEIIDSAREMLLI